MAARARVRRGDPPPLERGGRVLGICGGLQMLGDRIEDPDEVETEADGLGLLSLVTWLRPEKLTRPTDARFEVLPPPWRELSGVRLTGYEIRHGRSTGGPDLHEAIGAGLGYVCGSVLAVYVHGVFEEPEVLAAMFGGEATGPLDDTFDEIADAVEAHMDFATIERLAGV